jgi:hypothetical protein
MCFFFTFAPALEARMGHMRFLFFYLVSGVVSALFNLITDPAGIAHLLGASGAIGGVLGAYVIYFPRARVGMWSWWLTPTTSIGAFFLGDFFLSQWLAIWQESFLSPGESAGVGYWAHIGGIVVGMVVATCMVLYDVGRWRGKHLVLYLLAAVATGSVFALTRRAPATVAVLAELAAVVVVTAVYVARFAPPGRSSWKKELGTPLLVMTVCLMLGFCVAQAVSVWQPDVEWRQLHTGLAAMTLMLVSVIVAAAARRLPIVVPPVVIVPVPEPDERVLPEQAADLVVGFFSFVSCRLAVGRDAVAFALCLTIAVTGRAWRWGRQRVRQNAKVT